VPADSEHIGTLLLEEGLLTRRDLERAAAVQAESGLPLTRVLVEEHIVAEGDIVRVLARRSGIEFVNLADFSIDPAAAALLPDSLARRYAAIPIGFENDRLVVAMADPGHVLVVDDIRAVTGMRISARIASRGDIHDAIRRMARYDSSVADLADMVAEGEAVEDLSKIEAAVEEAPVVKLINTLITRAVNERASDVHLEPGEQDLRVRFRIDGVLHEVMTTPRAVSGAVVSRVKIMADLDIAERRVPQDGRVGLRVNGRAIDLRVATLPTIYGEKVVIRILDKDDAVLQLSDLGFLDHSLTRFSGALAKPYGTILVTGPTGSGKTTTL
jgi:type IV pilus assembly protein PilB